MQRGRAVRRYRQTCLFGKGNAVVVQRGTGEMAYTANTCLAPCGRV